MMRVKSLVFNDDSELELKINEFLESINDRANFIDIKYSLSQTYYPNRDQGNVIYGALIIYRFI